MATKILRLKLKNFIGIDKGLGLKEVELDFTKTDKRLILLLGGNGKGKTTIQSTMHPFAGTFDVRNSSFILDGKEGLKEIDIEQDGRVYKVVHYYSDKKNKSFIKRVDLDGTETELNPAGTIRSFPPIIQEELGLTEEFFKLIKVGSQTENFIDLESSKRKDFIGKFTPDISPFLDAYKVVSGKYTASNRDIRFLADELSKLETRDAVSKNIGIKRTSLNALKEKLASFQGDAAVLEAKLEDSQEVLEESRELDEKFNELTASIEENEAHIAETNEIYKGKMVLEGEGIKEVKVRLGNYEKKLESTQKDLSDARVNFASASQEVRSLNDNISRNRNEIKNLTTGSEGNSTELKSRISSLTSDFNTVSKGRFELEGFYEVFENADVSTSSLIASNTKNIVGNLITSINVNAPAGLSDFIETWSPTGINDLLNIVASNIESIEKKIKAADTKNKQLRSELETLEKEKYAAQSAADLIQYCSMGKECCLYVKVKELNKDSSNTLIDELETNIAVSAKYVREKTEEVESLREISAYAEGLLRYSANSEELVNILSAINENSDTEFDNLADALLTSPINQLEAFSINLDKQVNRFKVMVKLKSLADAIERSNRSLAKFSTSEGAIAILEANIDEDSKKLVTAKERTNEIQAEVYALEASEKRYTTITKRLNSIIDALTLIGVSTKELTTVSKRISKLAKSSKDALESESMLKELREKINTVNEDIEYVEDDLNKSRLALARIDEFVERKEKLEVDRKKFSIIKDSLDIRLGIPLVLVGDYLNDIRDTTNALLDVVFRGKFYIDFDVSDKAFSIPVYNNGVCTAGDILMCSQGEVSLVKTSLSLGIVIQAISAMSNQYNIVQLDEIDAQLDSGYRMTFLQMLDKQLDALKSEQCFVITHNDCFFSSDAALIILPGHTADITDEEFMSNKDIVADFS